MMPEDIFMRAIRVGVREFRERMASFPESDTPAAVTRRGKTPRIYVRARRKRTESANFSELKEAADGLAEALADIQEDELVVEFRQARRRGRKSDNDRQR